MYSIESRVDSIVRVAFRTFFDPLQFNKMDLVPAGDRKSQAGSC